MKKNLILYKIFEFLFLANTLILFSSCDSLKKKEPNLPTGKSAAFFDSFSYKGEDDFYKENPLPAKDYFYNPILPGWYSDPSICFNGEEYFLVTSTFAYFPGVPIFHSRDLVNWQQIGHVLNRPSQLKLDGQKTNQGIFAPAIAYNPHNQTYYMITTHVGAGNFFVKTKDPFGEWSEPIWLPEVQGIDPSFFFDEDGKAYIVNNDAPEGPALYDGHRAIRVQEFDVATDKTFGPRKVLVDGGIHPEEKPIWIEGPHIYKINGQYFLMAAEGGTSVNHSEVILRSKSPMGPYKAWDKNPILTQRHLDPKRTEPITCAGHADLIQTKEGDWWSVFLACRPINGMFENLGRETFLMPVKWSEDGFPYMTQGDDLIPLVLKKEGISRMPNTTFGNFEIEENFDSTALGLNWFSLRTPATDLYSLTENPGYLTLRCANVNTTEDKTPAFVCRRMQHHQFECTTIMYFEPSNEEEAAGVLLYKDETHQYFLSASKSDKYRKISLNKISSSGSETIATNTINDNNKPIRFKVISKGTHYDFYFGIGEEPWKLLVQNVDAHYLSTANSFGFTGTTIGMYATNKKL